jgi:two-component system sensor histidine kinase ChvG
MKPLRVALGIRAQLLLVLTVFLAIPWLGYEYVRELERFLRDAQERTLAGTAQAVATALHDRPKLFDAGPAPGDTLATERTPAERAPAVAPVVAPPPRAVGQRSPEIEQIIQGLSRTTARIFVVDRDLAVLARAGSLKGARPPGTPPPDATLSRFWQWLDRLLHPLYALLLLQPTEDFNEEQGGRILLPAREIDGALAGILTVERRNTPDGRAVVVSAAHPIWVGDQVRGAVIVEETTNAVLAERNRAFERLFSIVLATLLVGSVALTLFASRLSARIRRLRDEAEAAIDEHGRVRGAVSASAAGDEIGDLSRSFSSVLSRLSQHASHQQNMASRLSHELRTPVAVVRSSLDNLRLATLPDEARVYIERAQLGLNRLTHILTRMTEAARLEQSLGDAARERFDLARVVAGSVDGYRIAYPHKRIVFESPGGEMPVLGAPELIAQMLDKLVANAAEFATTDAAIVVRLARIETETGPQVRLAVENEGPPLPAAMRGSLFDSMVSVRAKSAGDEPHLGLGLYIVRLIAEYHGGSARADDRADGRGVVMAVTLPLTHDWLQ